MLVFWERKWALLLHNVEEVIECRITALESRVAWNRRLGGNVMVSLPRLDAVIIISATAVGDNHLT